MSGDGPIDSQAEALDTESCSFSIAGISQCFNDAVSYGVDAVVGLVTKNDGLSGQAVDAIENRNEQIENVLNSMNAPKP